MGRNLKKQFGNVLVWLLIFVFIAGFLPVPSAANTPIGAMTPLESVDQMQQELNQNKAELRQDLENKGYEVSEENLDRYINAVVSAYQNGIEYVMSNEARLGAALQDAVAEGYSQAQLEQLNESLISQMMLDSGFNPDAIAQDIFPLKSTASTGETPAGSPNETPESTELPSSPAQSTDEGTSGAMRPEDADDKDATYFTATEDNSIFCPDENAMPEFSN